MSEFKKLLKKLEKVKYFDAGPCTLVKTYHISPGSKKSYKKQSGKTTLTINRIKQIDGSLIIYSYKGSEDCISIKYEGFGFYDNHITSILDLHIYDAEKAFKIIKKILTIDDEEQLMRYLMNKLPEECSYF